MNPQKKLTKILLLMMTAGFASATPLQEQNINSTDSNNIVSEFSLNSEQSVLEQLLQNKTWGETFKLVMLQNENSPFEIITAENSNVPHAESLLLSLNDSKAFLKSVLQKLQGVGSIKTMNWDAKVEAEKNLTSLANGMASLLLYINDLDSLENCVELLPVFQTVFPNMTQNDIEEVWNSRIAHDGRMVIPDKYNNLIAALVGISEGLNDILYDIVMVS